MSGACQPSSAEQQTKTKSDQAGVPLSVSDPKSQEESVMPNVIHVNHKQFASEVLNSDIPVVVDFYASWCAPCRALEPILALLSNEFEGQIKFVKVNSDEEPAIADEYEVSSLPTLIMIDEKGRNEGRYLGSHQETEIRLHLQKWLASHEVATQ